MDTTAAGHGIQFSTDVLPERDRLPYLREAFGRSIVGLDLQPFQNCPLEWTASLHAFEGLLAVSGRTSAIISRRTRPLLADGKDDFLLTINLSGVCLPSQVGRECRLDAGAAALLSSSDVGGLELPCPTRYLTLFIPRRRLNAMAVSPEDALARPIPANTEALRLLVDYVAMSVQKHQLTSAQLRQLFTSHVHDLVALAVGATRDATEIAYSRGMRAARLRAAKTFVIQNIARPDLSASGVAAHSRITPRYLHMLFETDGLSFTKFVVEQRLARAHQMLLDPRMAERTISAIAFAAGFSDLSHFNRAFRQHFGETPTDARRVS
jgi:AraC-like DNA-binding protein